MVLCELRWEGEQESAKGRQERAGRLSQQGAWTAGGGCEPREVGSSSDDLRIVIPRGGSPRGGDESGNLQDQI